MARGLSASAVAELEARLAHSFADKSLPRRALAHAGATARPHPDSQRLEFLGDRVLGLIIAEELFRRFPDVPEGPLARRYNALVSKTACTAVAEAIDLRGLVGGGGVTARVLADICEALLAAVYIDAGLEAVRAVVLRHWQALLMVAEDTRRDPKSQLQEWALGRALAMPTYVVIAREGPDHAPSFTSEVTVEGHDPVSGSGASKREAEQAAAEAFIDRHRIERT